ncbi:MAG: HAMP domain-containing histidine kinase [Thermoproteota archaeon]|nr:HAMP domain-containing histidine kinase [Thermoproteota archaeon]
MIYDIESAISYGVRFLQNVKERMDVFVDEKGPSMIIKSQIYKDKYIQARNRGAIIRFVTEITKENIHYCKELKKIVDEFRHINGLKGSIAINDLEFLGSTTWTESLLLTPVIYSNEKGIVEQQQYIFDTFWKNAIPYKNRLMEIEEGIVPEVIETSSNSNDIQKKIFNLLGSANSEILVILSSSNAFHRQARAGSIQKLKEIRRNKPWISIKVLTPKDVNIEKMAIKLANLDFVIRFIEPVSKVSILIVDRKYTLIVELKDDTKQKSTDAIGLATYSNSNATVLSYAAIFDSFWKQAELYEQLQLNDAFKTEFLSMISHELRTPLVPIKGYAEMLLKPQLLGELNEKQIKAILSIYRNAQKQESLVEDILTIYTFETGKIVLSKKEFMLSDLLINVINDLKPLLEEKKISIVTEINTKIGNTVYCDEKRIEQVLSNLIKNSVDFVPKSKGKITITISEKESQFAKKTDDSHYDQGSMLSNIVFTVKDNGKGIPDEKIDLLFKKFFKIDTTMTRKHGSTGLGLVICKDIVEAHGGTIWIDRNYTKGASILFTIPVSMDTTINH